jgi:predicted O-methyltransferase YrrM
VWLTEEPYEVDDSTRWSKHFQTVFLNDASTLDRHANAHALPVGFDPLVYRDAGLARSHAVGFIGAANPSRERYLLKLAERGLLSYLIGGPWQAPALKQLCLAPNIPARETAALYQRTSIVLNIFRDRHHFNARGVAAEAMNPRIYEALACGALVVSEPRPEISKQFPDLPTFSSPNSLVEKVTELVAAPRLRSRLLELSRARLSGHDYAARLKHVIEIATQNGRGNSMKKMLLKESTKGSSEAINLLPPIPPDIPGWKVVGVGCATVSDGTIQIAPLDGKESGLASVHSMRSVRLRAKIKLSSTCQFVAKVRHAVCGDHDANSYHLVSTGPGSQRTYMARHHQVLMSARLPRGRWFQMELYCEGPQMRLCIDGDEVGRCVDGTLTEGFAFIGSSGGMLNVKDISVEELAAPDPCAVLHGWRVHGAGVSATGASSLVLAANGNEGASITSEVALNDVELEFELNLDAHACFIAKLHHQDAEDANANSYHLIAAASQGFLARHNHALGQVRLARGRWQRVALRWVDQQLTVNLDGRAVLKVGDNLLQSGYCVLGVSAGCAEIRQLAIRDVTGKWNERRAGGVTIEAKVPALVKELPFTCTPRRHLMYHIWPVRGSMWRWNVERLLADIDLFNGRRVIGIVHDSRSEPPEEVRAAFEGHGCEFVEIPNSPIGECLTFPAMLKSVASLDPNDVTFYGHAKGVKHGKDASASIRRWTEALYDASLNQWPLVAEHLKRHALTGSFRMLGRFRAHQHLGDWHYSGTFFWMRNALVFSRAIDTIPQFYGGVEVWPGLHFRREETGCLLLDNLRELPYNEAFWQSHGNLAVARLKATRQGVAPPASLKDPMAFEGYTSPRLEQIPNEFAWFLDKLVAAAPSTILTIGSMHGGVEWHIARRFRQQSLDIQITAVDLGGRPELAQTIADARSRWAQKVDFVVGDSTLASTRDKLAPHYDAVFIDGDHGYRGARLDYEFAITRTPRVIALHDIVDSMWHADARCCVSRLWSEIELSGSSEACRLGEWGGIGIQMVPPPHSQTEMKC